MKLLLLIALLLVAPALQGAPSIMAVPSTATTDQVVAIIAVSLPLDSRWSLSGGVWCQSEACKWRSDEELSAAEAHIPRWRASTAGDYTITLTTPEGSASVTITVTEP